MAVNKKTWERILKAFLSSAGSKSVKAGVMSGNAQRDGSEELTNVDVAYIHEFGSLENSIPERSFVRAPFSKNREKYLDTLAAVVEKSFSGKMKPAKGLELIGAQMAADMQNEIRRGIPPANAPSTVARKNSSKPLIDTGQLVNSITWAVTKDGGEK